MFRIYSGTLWCWPCRRRQRLLLKPDLTARRWRRWRLSASTMALTSSQWPRGECRRRHSMSRRQSTASSPRRSSTVRRGPAASAVHGGAAVASWQTRRRRKTERSVNDAREFSLAASPATGAVVDCLCLQVWPVHSRFAIKQNVHKSISHAADKVFWHFKKNCDSQVTWIATVWKILHTKPEMHFTSECGPTSESKTGRRTKPFSIPSTTTIDRLRKKYLRKKS